MKKEKYREWEAEIISKILKGRDQWYGKKMKIGYQNRKDVV